MNINIMMPLKSNDKLFIALTCDYALINNIRKKFIKIPYNGINQFLLPIVILCILFVPKEWYRYTSQWLNQRYTVSEYAVTLTYQYSNLTRDSISGAAAVVVLVVITMTSLYLS
jgi:hypothetical protein